MSDKRPVFPGLEDQTTKGGLPWHGAQEGDSENDRQSAPILTVKKSDGTLQYIPMDAAGNIPVTLDGAGACKSASTDATPVAGSNSKTQVCEISLTVAKIYRQLEWSVCNFRDTIYDIEVIDDPAGAATVVAAHTVLVGNGDLTDSGVLKCFEFDTTGLTSPVLRLSGTNLNAESDFRGTIAITEDAA
jgi:hypothetical protein